LEKMIMMQLSEEAKHKEKFSRITKGCMHAKVVSKKQEEKKIGFSVGHNVSVDKVREKYQELFSSEQKKLEEKYSNLTNKFEKM
jgi:hypothetical protein